MTLVISVTILIFITAYILLVSVVISFSLDNSLSGNLRIKIFSFNLLRTFIKIKKGTAENTKD